MIQEDKEKLWKNDAQIENCHKKRNKQTPRVRALVFLVNVRASGSQIEKQAATRTKTKEYTRKKRDDHHQQ